MSFYDVRRISYDRLTQRVASDKPYKDSGNAYPLGDRRYSDRHFRHEKDGTFTIWYSDREIVDNKYGKFNDKSDRYINYTDSVNRRMVGIVRPDNSFEFVVETAMGENMLLSRALSANVHHDKSKGGTVYEKGRLNHPVFRGLRINCDTGEAMTPYSVFLPKVKRKAANEVMQKYEDFIAIFSAMISSMDDRGIWEVFMDMYTHEAESDEGLWRGLDMAVVKRLIDEKKYVDAGCLFHMLSRGSHMRWRVEWQMREDAQSATNNTLSSNWRINAQRDISVNFRKMILKQHPEVFVFTELEKNAHLPSSQWSLLIQSDGNPVFRL